MKLIRCERCGAEVFHQSRIMLQTIWRIHNSVVHPGEKVNRAVIVEVN